jgi:hypothetical protein
MRQKLGYLFVGFVAGLISAGGLAGATDQGDRDTVMPHSQPDGQLPSTQDLSLSAAVFVDGLGPLMRSHLERGGDFEHLDVERFCPVDRAMNTMTVNEREYSAFAFDWARNALVGKNALAAQGLPMPLHTFCPEEQPGLPANPKGTRDPQ